MGLKLEVMPNSDAEVLDEFESIVETRLQGVGPSVEQAIGGITLQQPLIPEGALGTFYDGPAICGSVNDKGESDQQADDDEWEDQ